MKALVFTAPAVVEVQDLEEPQAAQGEVLVEVEACGICGSELHGIRHPGFRQPPLVMGHEFAGRDPEGRRVVVNPIVSCGECDSCLRGQDQLCRTRSVIGIHRPGGFGERVAVPSRQLHKLPDDLTWEAAALIEPLANAVHAHGLVAGLQPQRIGVIGAGPIGLVCVLVARHNRIPEIEVADLAPDRLELAGRLGAMRTGQTLEGEFDVVFDCVGAPATRRASVERLRPGGSTVWLGLLAEEPAFDALNLIRMEKRVNGSFAYPAADFKAAVAMAPYVDLGWTADFPLAHGDRIFNELMNGRTDVAKALLRPARTIS